MRRDAREREVGPEPNITTSYILGGEDDGEVEKSAKEEGGREI